MTDRPPCIVPGCPNRSRHRHTGRGIPTQYPAELWITHAQGIDPKAVQLTYRPTPRSKVRTLGGWDDPEAAARWLEVTAAGIRQSMAEQAEAEAAGVPWYMLP